MAGFMIAGSAALGALSGRSNRRAAERANAPQQQAAAQSAAEMRRQYDIGRADLAPWVQEGRKGLEEQRSLMGFGGDTAGAMRSLQSSPGYQFRMQQGNRNLEGGLAARGGMGSGRSLAAGQQYAQGLVSQEYENRLSQLARLSGQGQASAAGQAQMGQQYGQNVSNLWTGAANAGAAATMAGSQAQQQGLLGGLQLGLAGYNAMNQPQQFQFPTNEQNYGSGIDYNTWMGR